jgi:hypothetical protein
VAQSAALPLTRRQTCRSARVQKAALEAAAERRGAIVVPEQPAELVDFFLNCEASDMEFFVARTRERLDKNFFAAIDNAIGEERFLDEPDEDRIAELEGLCAYVTQTLQAQAAVATGALCSQARAASRWSCTQHHGLCMVRAFTFIMSSQLAIAGGILTCPAACRRAVDDGAAEEAADGGRRHAANDPRHGRQQRDRPRADPAAAAKHRWRHSRWTGAGARTLATSAHRPVLRTTRLSHSPAHAWRSSAQNNKPYLQAATMMSKICDACAKYVIVPDKSAQEEARVKAALAASEQGQAQQQPRQQHGRQGGQEQGGLGERKTAGGLILP